MREVDK